MTKCVIYQLVRDINVRYTGDKASLDWCGCLSHWVTVFKKKRWKTVKNCQKQSIFDRPYEDDWRILKDLAQNMLRLARLVKSTILLQILIFTELALCADSVYKLQCPSVCLCVCNLSTPRRGMVTSSQRGSSWKSFKKYICFFARGKNLLNKIKKN